MIKTASNRDICFIKAVLLFCEHGHFSLNFASHGLAYRITEKFSNSLYIMNYDINYLSNYRKI